MSKQTEVMPDDLQWKDGSVGRSVYWSCLYKPGNAFFSIWNYERIFSEKEKYELRCSDFFESVDGFDKKWSFLTLEEAKEFALQIAAERRDVLQKHLAKLKQEERLTCRRHLRMMPVRWAYRVAHPFWLCARFLSCIWMSPPTLVLGRSSTPSTEQELRFARLYLQVTNPVRKIANWRIS